MNNPHSIESDRHAGRFRYASGEKPLDGYTINRGIGIGGFGEVYFAVSDAGKEVALKRIQRNLDVELRGVQNCLNLKHPNLISLWDIRVDSVGESWVVMEYVPGPSLREIIEVSDNGMPGHQIERWFGSIASAVEYLHNRGIVHRDLKPGNIFLDEDEGLIKIGDYGLSKLISGGERSHQTETVGTFHYMAPEIGKGNYGKGVDIYAMGIVLYEMLTGRVPFTGESSQEIIMKHLTAVPDMSEVPFDFRDVVQCALEKDPDTRFESIGQMREYLPFGQEYDSSSPQNSVEATIPILNPDRMNPVRPEPSTDKFKETVRRTPPLPENKRGFATVDDGIQFGPLRDSTSGSVVEEVSTASGDLLYIGNVEAEIVESGIEQISPGETDVAVVADESAEVAEVAGEADTVDVTETKTAADEPIAVAVKSGWSQVALWWNDNTVSTPLKVFMLLIGGFVVVANSQWVLPAGLALGLIYLVYYGFRHLIISTPDKAISTETKKLTRQQQREVLLSDHYGGQDLIAQAADVVSSLLASAIVCLSLNLLGLAITGSLFQSDIDSWAVCAWSTCICIAASWSILLLSRMQITSDAEPLTRRIVMLITGVLIGGLGFVLGLYLNVDFAANAAATFNPLGLAPSLAGPSGGLISSLLFFAAMFGLLRWWKQTDPTRRTRLSLWSVGLCLMWAALISHAVNFAPLWNCISIATIAIAVQLASAWIPRAERQTILDRSYKA